MNWAEQLAKETDRSLGWIYTVSRKLGRKATVEDIVECQKRGKGRPSKY